MKPYRHENTLSHRHIKADQAANAKVPAGMWIKCRNCQAALTPRQLGKFSVCPHCGYGFRIGARPRLSWLTDDFTANLDADLDGKLEDAGLADFPGYQEKLKKARKVTGLKDSVLTGRAKIKGQECALGIMDPGFIMGSLGTVAGEKITRLFERATDQKLPVVLFTASGGARMQEGILSLMQMAKISNAVAAHKQAGLLYISVLTDPTTGGVTASFAMDGDIILAEPHALVSFAGRRVIEQTIHEQVSQSLQQAENVLKHGFIDRIVERQEEKQVLSWLLKYGGRFDG